MTQQSNDKLFSRWKNKLKKPRFTTMPDYPSERCPDGVTPERCELQLAMKFVRRRRINIKKKYRAVLENGSLELHHPKQNELNGFTIEYRVDLAKVLLLYDEHRVVVKLQTEVLLLYPVTVTVDRLREVMHQHRLWSQEKMAEKGIVPSITDTGLFVAAPCVSEASAIESVFMATDSEPSGNPTQDFLRETHAMSLAILDASSRHLEMMTGVVDEITGLIENLKKKKETPKPAALPVPVTAAPPTVTLSVKEVKEAPKDVAAMKTTPSVKARNAASAVNATPPPKDIPLPASAPGTKESLVPKKPEEDDDDDDEEEEEDEKKDEKK